MYVACSVAVALQSRLEFQEQGIPLRNLHVLLLTMAEQRMEAIQSARRKAVDYDPLSSDDEEHTEEIDLSIFWW